MCIGSVIGPHLLGAGSSKAGVCGSGGQGLVARCAETLIQVVDSRTRGFLTLSESLCAYPEGACLSWIAGSQAQSNEALWVYNDSGGSFCPVISPHACFMAI